MTLILTFAAALGFGLVSGFLFGCGRTARIQYDAGYTDGWQERGSVLAQPRQTLKPRPELLCKN